MKQVNEQLKEIIRKKDEKISELNEKISELEDRVLELEMNNPAAMNAAIEDMREEGIFKTDFD